MYPTGWNNVSVFNSCHIAASMIQQGEEMETTKVNTGCSSHYLMGFLLFPIDWDCTLGIKGSHGLVNLNITIQDERMKILKPASSDQLLKECHWQYGVKEDEEKEEEPSLKNEQSLKEYRRLGETCLTEASL